ncbi:hypothetical protein [Streptomyces sp. WAC05858]|uniref:hypothetical protein n=1 Tax=Streptomyces TaxID=1883 RepID=UPI000F77A406|nr:hypothetical protein [Streptomyces sp. WAC05858]RSS34696.1 hypothetical protein EF902_40070 [Streptomyces sp. WAC05858]
MNRTVTPPPPASLFDGDAASTELGRRRRSLTLVPDLQVPAGPDLEDEAWESIRVAYLTALEQRDFDAMAAAYLDAADMDESRPGQPKLIPVLDAAGVRLQFEAVA